MDFAVKQMDISSNNARRNQVKQDLKFMLRVGQDQHPHIVRFYGYALIKYKAFIVMELMDTCCGSLLEKFPSGLPLQVTAVICTSVVRGLNHLKSVYNMIHRDVRPPNILVHRNGSVKLCDFGVSRELVHSMASTRGVGFELYLAPERLSNGNKKYKIQADVWSLGITLIELSSGRNPYQGMDAFVVLHTIVNKPSPELPADAFFPPEFREFVCRCLEKDPKVRPNYGQLMLMDFFTNQDMESGPMLVSLWMQETE